MDRPSRRYRETPRYKRDVKAFGAHLRTIRKSRKLTLEGVSGLTELDPTHIQKIEAGKINFTFATIVRLAEGFDIDVNELLDFTAE